MNGGRDHPTPDRSDQATSDRADGPTPDRADQPTSDPNDDDDPPGRLARIKTGVTEAAGVVVDAVLDAI
jgi:hypothetical protein